jgi:hypothetical protein
MKVGELVTYSESGKEYNALVLGERNFADHAGKDGEPLLTLVFAKARLDPHGVPLPLHGTGQTNELVQVRLDVAHESHEYTEKQQRAFGKKQYDGGRWKEAASEYGFDALSSKLSSRESTIKSLSASLSSTQSALSAAQSEAEVAKAEASKFKAAAVTHLARAEDAEGKLLTKELTPPTPKSEA